MGEGLTPQSCNKFFLIGLGCGDLFHRHKVYGDEINLHNLINLIAISSGQIWINVLRRVTRYDLFEEERYNIWRISDTYKKIIYFYFAEISLHASY